jgi:hypothetical protein
MSTAERKCIGAPEQQECINDERQEVPRGPSGVLTGWPQGYRFVLPLRGVEAQDRTDQSLPNPRGGSAACSSARSRSQIARRSSAVAPSCRLSGGASSQTAYCACNSVHWATASCQRRVRPKRPPARVTYTNIHYHCLSPGQVASGLRVAPRKICDSITAFLNPF